MNLKRETQGETWKSMKIKVTCTVHSQVSSGEDLWIKAFVQKFHHGFVRIYIFVGLGMHFHHGEDVWFKIKINFAQHGNGSLYDWLKIPDTNDATCTYSEGIYKKLNKT